jgi:hypothetical protein
MWCAASRLCLSLKRSCLVLHCKNKARHRTPLQRPEHPRAQGTQTQLTGSWSAAQLKEGLELAMGGCQQLGAVLRQTLLEAAGAGAGA